MHLNFYAKKYGDKAPWMRFVCFETEQAKEEGKENDASERREFAFFHAFERMIPLWWQEFFEKNLKIPLKDPNGFQDCYQFHAFIIKKNTWGMNQRRFMVLTNLWMFNVEGDFDSKSPYCIFKGMKWRMPIEAITNVEINQDDGMIHLTLKFDFLRNNMILVSNGFPKLPQDSCTRKLKFPDAVTTRTFLFHIIRIQHLHCCSVIAQSKKNVYPKLIVKDNTKKH